MLPEQQVYGESMSTLMTDVAMPVSVPVLTVLTGVPVVGRTAQLVELMDNKSVEEVTLMHPVPLITTQPILQISPANIFQTKSG